MRVYDVSFYLILFFLIGIFLAGSRLSFLIIIAAAVLIAALFLFVHYLNPETGKRIFWLSLLSLFIIAGAFYYFAREIYQIKNTRIVFEKKIDFSGLVLKNYGQGEGQKLIIELKKPYSGKILLSLKSYPALHYGDLIKFNGIIKKVDEESADYLAKENVYGTTNFPKIESVSENNGSPIKQFLLSIKNKFIAVFQKVLSFEKSSFLAGITLGERSEFSKEFKQQMSQSGTTHLVALSGYNITILVWVVANIFSAFLSRRLSFYLTIAAIIAFVLMTGAEPSVVRAAMMGGILLMAGQVGRLYSFRNAMAVAAFLMVLENPKVLRFDVGFQLSFMALIGIVYLLPAIKDYFKVREKSDVFSLKENFLTTLSAQLAVAPILISSFGNFSLLSLLSNVLILSVIPLTMGLGFILGILGFFSYYLSLIFGWFVNLFLSYEIFVIKFVGSLNLLQIRSFNIPLAVIYYLFLIFFIIYVKRSKRFKP